MKNAEAEALSDAELARGVARGGERAPALEAELVRRFAPRVRLYGLRHLRGGEPEADDLVQRVLVLTLEKLRNGDVQKPEKIGSFVLGTARTLTRTVRRSDRLVLGDPPAGSEGVSIPPLEPDPHLRAHLTRCLEALGERERTLLVLTFADEQDADEIGSALGMAATNVRVTRHRALAKLRDCLRRCSEEDA